MANIAGGSVLWTLDAEDGNFKSKIKGASSDVAGLGNVVEKESARSNRAFESIAKVGLASLATAAVATGALIAKNIGAAVQRVDTLNNFPRVLTAMGVGSDQATAATKELAKQLTGLPTPLQEGAAGVQRFVAAGLDIDKSTGLFLAMNNALIAGGGNAMDAQIAMDGMVRAISSGEVPSSTLVAMFSRMPTVMASLTKSTGKSQDELVKLFETNPKALVDNLIQLNTVGGGGMASLDKQAREATAGIGTGFSNMNTAIQRGIASIIQSVGSDKIATSIANIGKNIETTLKNIGKGMEFIQRNSDIFGPIAVAIGTLVTLLTAWYIGVKLVAAYHAILNAVMAANPIGLIIVAVAALIAGLVYFFTKTETGRKIFAKFTEVAKKGFEILVGAGKAVVNFFKNNWKIIAAVALAPLLPLIGFIVLLVKNFDHIKNAAMAVWNVVQTVFSAIWSFLQPILNFIMNLFIIVFGGIAILVIMAVQKIYNIVTSVIGAVWSFIQPILMGIWNFFTAVWSGIYNVVKTYLTMLFNFYKTIFTAVYDTIVAIVSSIINFFAPAVSWLYNKGKDIIQGLINGIKGLAGGLWNAIKSVADQIGNFFSGAWNWLFGVGQAIIQGLINGIKNMAGKVTQAVSDTANSIKNKFKSLLGINSPSKVFADFGLNIGQGLTKGIDKTQSSVASAISGLASNTVDVQANVAPNVGEFGTTSGANNQTVTIGTVVLNTPQAAKAFFDELNQDTINLGMGLTPVQGA